MEFRGLSKDFFYRAVELRQKPQFLKTEIGSLSEILNLFRAYMFCCFCYIFSFLTGKQLWLINDGLFFNTTGFNSAAVSLLWSHQPHRLVWSLQHHPRARFLLPGIQWQLWPGQPRNMVDSGKFRQQQQMRESKHLQWSTIPACGGLATPSSFDLGKQTESHNPWISIL